MENLIKLSSESDYYNTILNEILIYINKLARSAIRANGEYLAISLNDMAKFLSKFPITYAVVEEAEEMLEEKEFSRFNEDLLYLTSSLEQLWDESSKSKKSCS